MLDSSQGHFSLYGDPNVDSTNGCSIISGLNISVHISSLDIQEVITNITIDDIMDVQAPPILNEIRKKSKMSGNIDWYTVQDYLLKKKSCRRTAGFNVDWVTSLTKISSRTKSLVLW
jgi:isopentenyl phosphate kinase